MSGTASVERAFCAACPLRKSLAEQVGQLQARILELEQQLARVEAERDEAVQQADQLRSELGTLHRRRKRQAAPFSKDAPTPHPKKPGRKAGASYGKKGHRPAPSKIDEVVQAELPETCPHCGGHDIEPERVAPQYQVDVPPEVVAHVRQFDVHIGSCGDCGNRVQGRHPLQTSDALGAAASQIGPTALALAADWKVRLGLSFELIAELFETLWKIRVTRGALSHALGRQSRAAAPTYEALRDAIRQSPVVSPDESGWRVAGRSAWVWVFVTEKITFYSIEFGRGFHQAAKVLGESFSGILVRDGWAAYRLFRNARHQTCLQHLLRRCRKNLETAQRGTARLPRAIRRILKAAISLRDQRDLGQLATEAFAEKLAGLRQRMSHFLTWKPVDDENRKLVKHLDCERDALFTFLETPGLPATNYLAEQAIRPIIRVRKNSGGGNRTWSGAAWTAILATVLRTARLQGLDPIALLVRLARAPRPTVAHEIVPALPPVGRDPPTTPPTALHG